MPDSPLTTAEKLISAVASVRLQGIEELGRRGETQPLSRAELQGLLDCLAAAEKPVQRGAAERLAALAECQEDVRRHLLVALGAADVRQRWGATFAVSLRGAVPPEAHPVLFEAIGDGDGDIRWAAADILVRKVPRSVLVPELCRHLRCGTATQRKMAAYCLRELNVRSPEIETAVVGCLQDESVGVRLAAVAALVRLSTDRRATAEHLSALLDDAEAGVRRSVAAALGSFTESSESVIAALRRALTDNDPSLRRAAASSLRRLQV